MSQFLTQERAKHALERVESVPRAVWAEYRRYVQSFPAVIRTIGLGQTVATWMAKAGSRKEKEEQAYGLLLDHLEEWLLKSNKSSPYHSKTSKGGSKLIHHIGEFDQNDYLLAQAEAILYLDWLKKFANALLVEPSKEPAGNAGEQP